MSIFKHGCKFKGIRKELATHADSSMQNHLSMAISKLDTLENKITLTVDTLENKIASKVNALENKIMLTVDALENKIASKVNALENKIMLTVDALENKIASKVESLETKIATKTVALENKITSTVESFENKNALEVVALENKITSTVDALKNELISKVDAQKDEIMFHEKNLEITMAFLAVKMKPFVNFHSLCNKFTWREWHIEGRCTRTQCFSALQSEYQGPHDFSSLQSAFQHHNLTVNLNPIDPIDFLINHIRHVVIRFTADNHIHAGSLYKFVSNLHKKYNKQ
ncbi:uncharacterized protein LOC136083949 isoform X1 [Hydra vulgaris]|uniref:Uncharacterized protein LOC136083949 isoform X1 n=2 Tax=Hydra vulgaris TaxID=6087 RepID=A0ABM4CE66_HYDVU